jgi:predicted ATPase
MGAVIGSLRLSLSPWSPSQNLSLAGREYSWCSDSLSGRSSGRKRVQYSGDGFEGLQGDREGFIRSITLDRTRVETFDRYPFSLPAVRALDSLELHPRVTFVVGENGMGKSTLIEAVAVAAGFNAEGGSVNLRFSTMTTESELHQYVRLTRSIRRQRTGFFLRAESFYNVASELERMGRDDRGTFASYGGTSLHQMSHGESFVALMRNRFGRDGLYLLDEPEAALSPLRQLAMLALMHQLVESNGCQFVIATHSPILMAYPEAWIYELTEAGIERVTYEHTEHYRLTKDFLDDPNRYFKELFTTGSSNQD